MLKSKRQLAYSHMPDFWFLLVWSTCRSYRHCTRCIYLPPGICSHHSASSFWWHIPAGRRFICCYFISASSAISVSVISDYSGTVIRYVRSLFRVDRRRHAETTDVIFWFVVHLCIGTKVKSQCSATASTTCRIVGRCKPSVKSIYKNAASILCRRISFDNSVCSIYYTVRLSCRLCLK